MCFGACGGGGGGGGEGGRIYCALFKFRGTLEVTELSCKTQHKPFKKLMIDSLGKAALVLTLIEAPKIGMYYTTIICLQRMRNSDILSSRDRLSHALGCYKKRSFLSSFFIQGLSIFSRHYLTSERILFSTSRGTRTVYRHCTRVFRFSSNFCLFFAAHQWKMKTLVCLTLLCLAVGAYSSYSKSEFMRLTNQMRQTYCNSDEALADYIGSQCYDLLYYGETYGDAVNLCQNCCVRISEAFKSCAGDSDADGLTQICVDTTGVCGAAFINAMAASTVLLMATLAYLLL